MQNIQIFFILSLSFIFRFISLFILGRNVTPEVWEYDTIALNIIQKKEYVIDQLNTTYHSLGYPLYPILCSIFHILTQRNYFILEIFQVILSVTTCYFVYLIAGKIYNKKVAYLSSFLVAVHPGLIVYSTKMHELTLVIFLITLIFWLILILDWAKTYNNFLIGALIGVGTLARPSLIFFLAVYFYYLTVSTRKFQYILKALSIVCLTTVLSILPWTLRNYKIHKRWIFITTSSAEHFWRGNNALASGSSLTKDGHSILEIAPKGFLERLYSMNEIKQYDFFYSETFKFIKCHPIFFVKMVCKKFFYFWWFSPQVGKIYPNLWTYVYKVYYSIIFLFFIFGSYFSIKKINCINKSAFISFFILFFLVSILHSLFYVEIRHRWAIEPLIIIISSYGFTFLFKNVGEKLKKTNKWGN